MSGSSALATQDGDTASMSDLDALVGYNLKRAYILFNADFRKTLGPEGLSPRSFSALSLAVGYPEITQSALARLLGIERSGLVSIVDELESLGYLGRVDVPGDRRVQALVPTQKGAEVYAAALAKVHEHEAGLLSKLTQSERETLLSLLQKLRTEPPI